MPRPATTPTTAAPEITYEDYMAMPVSNQQCEVVDGVLTIVPGPRYTHQAVEANLCLALKEFVVAHDLGQVLLAPADVVIRKRPKLRVRQPDVLFFSNARSGFRVSANLDRLQDEGTAPDLVVEVLSPGQTKKTLAEKLADYASIEVREVWLADPIARTLEVLALHDGQYGRIGFYGPADLVQSAVLPGLAIAVTAIFA